MKTDLEKFQKFFDNMNIKYSICTDEEESYMWIDDIHLVPNMLSLGLDNPLLPLFER